MGELLYTQKNQESAGYALVAPSLRKALETIRQNRFDIVNVTVLKQWLEVALAAKNTDNFLWLGLALNLQRACTLPRSFVKQGELLGGLFQQMMFNTRRGEVRLIRCTINGKVLVVINRRPRNINDWETLAERQDRKTRMEDFVEEYATKFIPKREIG